MIGSSAILNFLSQILKFTLNYKSPALMNPIRISLLIAFIFPLLFNGCKDDSSNTPAPKEPRLVFKFVFDSTQVRLDNLGNPSALPSNHGAQSPRFNKMSAHYIELTPNQFTQIGQGAVLYHNAETTAGGATAIDFSKSNPVGNNETFYSMPLKGVAPGTYDWLRVSLAYQNYEIDFRYSLNGTNYDLNATLASFIGYNTYLSSFKIKDSTVVVNANKPQGFWAFETIYNVSSGQSAAGATTVPNPIFATSPIPQGSCLVTGSFSQPLVITGNESSDIVVTVSLSTNKSFEWIENSTPGYFEPAAGDAVVDMGIRGMVVTTNQ
jgi:hypothetical protein